MIHSNFISIEDAGLYQRWTLALTTDGYYKITSVKSGMELTINYSDVSTANATLTQNEYEEGLTQDWKIEKTSNGSYRLSSRYAIQNSTNLSMGVANGAVDGAKVRQQAYTNDTTYNDEWYFFKDGTDVMLLGVPSTGHDHITCFSSVMKWFTLEDIGWGGFYCLHNDTIYKSNVLYVMDQASVFISRSHGPRDDETDSYIYLYNDMTEWSGEKLYAEDIYDFSTNTALYDLSNLDLVMFIGCNTAEGGESGENIVRAAHEAGANCAIGFEKAVHCVAVNTWTEVFCERLAKGYSVDAAEQYALDKTMRDHSEDATEYDLNLDSYCVIR